MPPRRPRTSPTTSFSKPRQNNGSKSNVTTPAALPPPTPAGRAMSPTSTYNHNLRSVRRRDPTITTIFDKFDHVCVYILQNGKWEKAGYEGAAFLFERESEPRYGLYILNRAGPDDYIQYIYPEDDLALPSATLVSYRIYPEYTAKRLSDPAWAAEVQAKAASAPWVDGKPPDPNAQKTKVGTSKMLGFWIILDKEGRNPIHDALVRLHGFVSKGERYPDLFRKAPDRPQSTIPAFNEAPGASGLPAPAATPYHTSAGQAIVGTQPTARSVSELDMLFAKLGPTSDGGVTALFQAPSGTPAHVPVQAAPAAAPPPVSPPALKAPSVNQLFASLIPTQAQSRSKPRSSIVSPTSTSAIPNAPPSQGMSLLNSIFASAGPGSVPQTGQLGFSQPVPMGEMNSAFRFPRPTDPNVSQHQAVQRSPEILSPKPTTSALPPVLGIPSGALASLMGHPHSRGSSAAGSISSSSAGSYEGNIAGNTVPYDGGGGMLRYNETADAPAALLNQGLRAPRETVTGDATPRARLSSLEAENAVPPTVPPGRATASFEDSSALWPGGAVSSGAAGALDLDDVVELDFSEIAALSDAAAFSARAGKGKGKGRGAAQPPQAPALGGLMSPGKGKKKGKKSEALTNGVAVSDKASPAGVPVHVEGQAGHRPRRSLVVEADDDEPAVNGHGASSAARPDSVEPTAIRPALLNALFASQANLNAKAEVSREVFVREVVRMLNTDKVFVDQLWQGYLARRAAA